MTRQRSRQNTHNVADANEIGAAVDLAAGQILEQNFTEKLSSLKKVGQNGRSFVAAGIADPGPASAGTKEDPFCEYTKQKRTGQSQLSPLACLRLGFYTQSTETQKQ